MVKPILFNTEMVRAILDGRKTVTRRVVPLDIVNRCDIEADGKSLISYENDSGDFIDPVKLCRYQLGDILYVRETWAPLYADDNSTEVVGYLYKADPDCQTMEDYDRKYPDGKDWTWEGRWRPSIHMPREAARIFLKITEVGVQQVKDITDEEAASEGFALKSEFISAFLRIYPDCTEDSWCWVIRFERIKKPPL